MEIPVKQHERQDVKDAKQAEMLNLQSHNTSSPVKYDGQPLISLKWVVTESEA